MLLKENLSEELGYCDTTEVEEFVKAKSNSFEIAVADIIAKQKANEIVTNAEYAAIPVGGIPGQSVAYGYFIVNFNYAKEIDEEKFIKFLSIIDFDLLDYCDILNMRAQFLYKLNIKNNFDFGAHYAFFLR